MLKSLLADGAIAAELGGLVAFVNSIFWLLLGYGTAFLAVPLIRYFWIQWQNQKIAARNSDREKLANILSSPNQKLQQKISYSQQFATEAIIGNDNLAYTTEKDLITQEIEQSDKIDAEWQRRLNQSDS